MIRETLEKYILGVIVVVGILFLFTLFGCIGNTVGWKNEKKIGVAEDFGKDNDARFGTIEKIKEINKELERLGD